MERVVSATALLQMSKKHFHTGRFWHKSCTKCSPLLVHACPQSTADLCICTDQIQGQQTPSGIEQARSLSSSASPGCSSRTRASPGSQPACTSFIQHSPWKNNFHFPVPHMLKKRLSETVTSLLYSTAHSSTRSIPRHKQPWTQKPNRTQTCSAIGLTTHLDLTFLKTSSTYSEGCNRGKTPALHIKKHSETNMCLTVHFTQLKKMQSHLVRWTNHYECNKEPPCSTSQLPVWKFSLDKT